MSGLMREDAARNAMRNYGFDERLINETIKELLELYGGTVDAWRLIEDDSYNVLLNRCLDKQEEQANQVAEEQEQEHEPHVIVLEEQEHEPHVETDAWSTTGEVMDASPLSLQSIQARDGYTPIEGAGWLSEEETDGHVIDDDDDDDDDVMIQLTPEPLCEELQELLRELQGQSKPNIK